MERRATYRLQVGPSLTLERVAELVPDLAALGISHLYLAPIWPAVRGSEHGYDVTGHGGVRAELGGDAALAELARRARAAGLGIVVDVVPSHVAASPETALWRALLATGPDGEAAPAFDVDWELGGGKVLLPILGGADDELVPARAGGAIVVRTPGGPVPASARSAGALLAALPDDALAAHGRRLAAETDDARLAALEDELARLCADPRRAALVDHALAAVKADPDRLRAFLDAQHWTAIPWRDPRRNVRRFFVIDGLAALRSDRADVFVRTHGAVARWVERGMVEGLRIDHVDGLRDPKLYLERLRALAPSAWILVEKILTAGEELPVEWAADGTTGYELARRATAVLVDEEGFPALEAGFRAFTGDARAWSEVARAARAEALDGLLAADFERCARAAERALRADRADRDGGAGRANGAAAPAAAPADGVDVRPALRALLVELDVYRTYLRPADARARREDRLRLQAARARALARDPSLAPGLDALCARLCDARPGTASAELVGRFQTLAPPLTAKAIEDTALYRHHPLGALCEVGCDPAEHGLGLPAFHAAIAREAARPTAGLFPLTTHDTKRSGDVRARLAALSEIPERWHAALARWSALARRHGAGGALDRGIEHLFWQTLVGAWPISAPRVVAYVEKAAREARVATSWADPDDSYEDALRALVRGVLGDPEIRADVEAFARSIEDAGRRNALAQVAIAATACGVPDVYAGDELELLALVDPDNRRRVDFARRARLVRELTDATPEQAWERRAEGAAKLFLWTRALRLRAERPAAFAPGATYAPLAAEGLHARRVIAYARGLGASAVVVVAPRLSLGLAEGWGDTALALPEGAWRDALGGDAVRSGRVPLARLVERFPVALLAHAGGPA